MSIWVGVLLVKGQAKRMFRPSNAHLFYLIKLKKRPHLQPTSWYTRAPTCRQRLKVGDMQSTCGRSLGGNACKACNACNSICGVGSYYMKVASNIKRQLGDKTSSNVENFQRHNQLKFHGVSYKNTECTVLVDRARASSRENYLGRLGMGSIAVGFVVGLGLSEHFSSGFRSFVRTTCNSIHQQHERRRRWRRRAMHTMPPPQSVSQ